MAKEIKRHITHLKSKVVENNAPKLISGSDIYEGEIAVNYAKGYETLSIKNESGETVTFLPRPYNSARGGETIHPIFDGTGTAGGTNLSAAWSGNCADIKTLYDGLTILYKVNTDGHASGDTLSINGGEAHKVVLNASGQLTTHYGVGSIIKLTYDSSVDGTFYTGSTTTKTTTGVWKIENYDSNTDTKVRQTLKSDNAERPLLMSYAANNSTTSNVDNVSYRSNLIYANASAGTITATNFVGKNNGFTIAKDVPSNAAFTDTATTLSGHYTITATTADTKSANASSTSELNWGSSVVTGVTISGDAKGHITAVSVASGNLKTPVTGVTLASGTNNGTVKLTVNGSATDNIAVKGLGTAAYKAEGYFAGSGHTHATSIATSTGTNQLTLGFGSKYSLNAGGTSYIFTMPSSASSWNSVTSVTTSSTAGNITVNGSNVAVAGLGGAAYLNTGTTAGTVAAGDHTHSAYVNQNAFSNVKLGSSTIAADSTTDTLEVVSGNSFIGLTADTTNDKLTIGVNTGTTSATVARGDHNHSGTYATNAFSRITVNTTNIDADSTGDTFTITAGTFVSLTGDATNDKMTIGVSTGTSSSTLARGDHNHSGVYQPVGSYLTGISSSDVTTALGYTPYNSSNPNNYTSNVGTVTSVQISLPTGLSASTTAVTSSGKFDIALSNGYSIPTTTKQGQWDTAYTNSHTHGNKSTLDAITASSTAINSLTGSVGTMAFQNTSSYSSATQVNTALEGKSNTGHGHSISEITNLQTTLDGKVNTGVTISAGTGLSGGGDLSTNRTISLAMPTTYSAETYTSSTIISSEPIVYALVRYTGTSSLSDQVCPVANLADGQQCNVIYQSANNNAYDAVISTNYIEPDGQAITLNVPAGGYAEINYINIKGIIFVRGI